MNNGPDIALYGFEANQQAGKVFFKCPPCAGDVRYLDIQKGLNFFGVAQLVREIIFFWQ